MLRGEIADPPAVLLREWVGQDEERVGPLADRGGNSAFDRCGFRRSTD